MTDKSQEDVRTALSLLSQRGCVTEPDKDGKRITIFSKTPRGRTISTTIKVCGSIVTLRDELKCAVSEADPTVMADWVRGRLIYEGLTAEESVQDFLAWKTFMENVCNEVSDLVEASATA